MEDPLNPAQPAVGAPDAVAPSASAPKAPRVHRLRTQVGLLVVLALIAAGALLFAIAERQGLFGEQVELYFIAEDVTGLAPGTTVRMSGFRVGKLRTLTLQSDHTVRVTLTIDQELFGRLKADARAVVVREQLKPAAIDLRPGKDATGLPRDNPRLAYTRRGTFNDIAEDLRSRLAPILDDIRQITSVVREHKGDMDTMLQNTTAITTAMAGAAQQLQGLSTELRTRAVGLGGQTEQAMQQVNRSLVRIDGLIGQADKGLDAVNNKLPGLLEKTDKTMSQLDQVLRDTRTITAAAAAGLPPLMRNAPPLVEESREMLQGLRESWPLRAVLPAPPPALLPIDSHDAAAPRQGGIGGEASK